MKVLMLKFVKNVGREGEVKEVSDGLAFNQLIPGKLAVPATKEVIAQHAKKQKEGATKEAAAKNAFAENVAKIAGKTLVMKVSTNDKGVLYQSVTAGLIRTFLLKEHKVVVPDHAIQGKPIRQMGQHIITIKGFDMVKTFTLDLQRQ